MRKHPRGYSIDYYAYLSPLRMWNASFKVLLSVSILLICIIADNIYVSAAIILGMGYLTVRKGNVHFQDYLALLRVPLAFIILGSLPIGVSISKHATGDYFMNFHYFYFYVTSESILTAVRVIVKAFGAISGMYMLTLSTPVNDIIMVLCKSHVPKLITELMSMIYRYIFILMDVQCRIRNSAESRLGYRDFKTACFTFGNSMSSLLIISLKKAGMYYDAMEARCYEGEMHFLKEEKPVEIRQIIAGALFIIIIILIKLFTEMEEGIVV